MTVELASQHNQVASLIAQGLSLHQQGKLNEAKSIYEKVLAIQENHFDAIQLLGALFIQTKQFTKAVDFLTKALKINPNHAAFLKRSCFTLSRDLAIPFNFVVMPH
jgi:tetratricopeptide (TPR) repeat protein